jgi:hypothetical protein
MSFLQTTVPSSSPTAEPAVLPPDLTAVEPINQTGGVFSAPTPSEPVAAVSTGDDHPGAGALPPTGQRDVWHVLRAALRGR